MSGCTPEMAQELERWLEGSHERRESPGEAQRKPTITGHLGGCAACRAHLDWLRTERALFAARARADRAAVPDFDGVLLRMQSPVVPLAPERERARRTFVDGRAFALSLCAAAALLCVAVPQGTPDAPVAMPEVRPAPRAAAEPGAAPASVIAPVAEDVAAGQACGAESCCAGDDAPCDDPQGEASESASASVPTSPEASLCNDGSCRSPDDHTPSAHARVEQRSDLTCSEDL